MLFLWGFLVLHLYMTKIGKDFVFSLNFFVFFGTGRAAFLTVVFFRKGQSRVPYSLNGKLQIASGKFRNCVAIVNAECEVRNE
jgi:hypothetical protein